MSFSIIAVTETWINENDSYGGVMPTIPGYSYFTYNRACKRGGGVALYARDNLYCNVVGVKNCENISSFEYLVVDIQSYQSRVGVIYRPPDTDMSKFNEEYDLLSRNISTTIKTLILAGDFNVNLLNCNSHEESDKFLETTYAHFIHPTITKPTRFCSTTSTLIDNIFVNDISSESLSGIIVSDVSDHLPVFLYFYCLVSQIRK